MIEIKQSGLNRFEVTVAAGSTTRHSVTVEPAYAEKLVGPDVSLETLLRESFEFLLEREPNTSILRHFELSVIEGYFPEYPTEIGKRLKG